MIRRPVKSSNVASIGFEAREDEPTGTLEVEFVSGHVYRYSDVPESEYRRLLGASSVGKHLNQFIKGTYDEERA